jgi:hypothetical protein
MIEVAQPSQANNANDESPNATKVLSYLALSIVVLVEIYLASAPPTITGKEFASMTVFP